MGDIVISTGLGLDIVGAIFIYNFGIISGADVDYGGLSLNVVVTPTENDKEDIAEKKRLEYRKKMSLAGVILLGGGFVLQFIGIWLPA